ncbi:MAG: tRNA pseudouridine(38-40) synthase TruA [Phycisphaeraceae bacterium]|nr:tRNA pseudouridine(38-40) synthase TruA [Phycisphaeraceae bacterium]
MPRYRLTIAYDGSEFHGWQKQEPPDPDAPVAVSPGVDGAPSARPRIEMRTVQGVVERAVREVVREPVVLLGASRTDAGVHARGQVAAFTSVDHPVDPEPGYAHEQKGIRVGWPAERGTEPLLRAINSRLPEDVLVVAAAPTTPAFDPIRGAVRKCYSYTFHVSKHRALWDRRFVHHVWTALDAGAMAAAAAGLVGTHDFAGFAAAGHGRLTTVRTVFACRVEARPAPSAIDPGAVRVRVEVEGDGFLYNMVRIIAGTLHEVGRGKIGAEQIPAIVASLDRRRAGPTIPASGLCLEWIRYEGDGQ